jgi:hypothetical protein
MAQMDQERIRELSDEATSVLLNKPARDPAARAAG